MSLTAELNNKDSPVTRWFAERVTNIKPISEEWNAAVKASPLIRCETDRRIPGTVGMAFDYRLRYWPAATPLEDLIPISSPPTPPASPVHRQTRLDHERGGRDDDPVRALPFSRIAPG